MHALASFLGLALASEVTIDESVERLLDLHRAGREAIRSLECQVHYTRFDHTLPDDVDPNVVRYHRIGEFRMSGSRTLATYFGPGEWASQFLIDGERVYLFAVSEKKRQTQRWSVELHRTNRHRLADTDARYGAQLLVESSRGEALALEEVVREAQHCERLPDEAVGNLKCQGLRCRLERSLYEGRAEPRIVQTMDFWLAPSHDYRVVRYRGEAANGLGTTVQFEHLIEEFTTIDGIAFPIQSVRRIKQSDPDFRSEQRWRFSKIRINHGISPERLALKLPPGTTVNDRLRNVKYLVDTTGKQVGPETPLLTGKPLAMDKAPPRVPLELPTAAEPPNRWSWLTLISLGLLCVAAGITAYRKWRAEDV